MSEERDGWLREPEPGWVDIENRSRVRVVYRASVAFHRSMNMTILPAS